MAKFKLKNKKGDKFYAYGISMMIPNDPDPIKITFQGSFDRRQLRKMLKKTLGGSWKVEELDFMIDNFGIPLRRATIDEVIAAVTDGEDDAED